MQRRQHPLQDPDVRLAVLPDGELLLDPDGGALPAQPRLLVHVHGHRGDTQVRNSGMGTVHKSIEVRGGGDLFSTACSKASRISSIIFISGDFGGQWKCLKSEECSWSHLVVTLDAWGVAWSFWNRPNPSECT
ncbi:hypothetical protein AVEN_205755-1 [Araneus ventricosus]|uniref:Uncharacterized protein n=1 Tax=Araneus ventricosus TaxID=182803 RepID=A0A4Y2QWR4_ARAVE|nr:hypothetical protein AVEN_205755-1 [Araneus ventricosus]